MSYYRDRRVTAAGLERWWESVDKGKMRATITLWSEAKDGGSYEESIEVPIEFVVCTLCEGKGTHVNPSIDSHGLTRDDFLEDPEFAEDYFRGVYDIPCNLCSGSNVIPKCSDPKIQKIIDEARQERQQHHLEVEAERRMGA